MGGVAAVSCGRYERRTSLLQPDEGRVEYLDVGTGAPTLYFHGTGAGSDAALLLEESLLRSGCRLIIPNRPGYYGTVLGPRGTAAFCTDLAAALLNYLGIERAAVIGTSGGGMLAACFARRHPDRTAALLLQCAQSHQWDDGKWLPTGLESALFLFRHQVFAPLLRRQNRRRAEASRRDPISCVQHMSGCRFPEIRDDPDLLQQITKLTEMAMECAAKPAGVQNDWAILVGNNGIVAETIACPTLIIHDRADPLVPFAHAEWSRTCISNSRILDIHAGGHLIWCGKESAFMHEQRTTFIHKWLAG